MLRCLQVDFRVMSNDATSTGKLSQLHWCYAACHLTGTYTRTQGVQNTQRHQQPCLLLMKLSSPLNGRKVAIRQRTSVRPTLPKSAPWQQHSNRGTLVWTDVLCRDTDRLWKRCDWNNVHRVNIEHLSISIFTCELWKVLLVCSLGMKLNAIRLFGWWPSCLVYTHLQWLPLTFQRDLKALFIACELGSCLISGSPMLYSRKDWITCCRHIFFAHRFLQAGPFPSWTSSMGHWTSGKRWPTWCWSRRFLAMDSSIWFLIFPWYFQ